MEAENNAYSNIRIENVRGFSYVSHTVISESPEEDALNHINTWALKQGIADPEIIGWDFPNLSDEQMNVYHFRGYEAACIIPPEHIANVKDVHLHKQNEQKYAVITVKDPFIGPFDLIPNAYKTLLEYIEEDGRCLFEENSEILPCFEKVYFKDNICYMDVYIAAELFI